MKGIIYLFITVFGLSGAFSINAQNVSQKDISNPVISSVSAKEFGEKSLEFIKSIKNKQDLLPENIERIFGIKIVYYDEKDPRRPRRFYSKTAVSDYQFWSFDFTNMEELLSVKDKNSFHLALYFHYFRPVPEGEPVPFVPYPPPFISDITPGCSIDFENFSKELQKDKFSMSKKFFQTNGQTKEWNIFKRGKTSVSIYVPKMPSQKAANAPPKVTYGEDGKPKGWDFSPAKSEISNCISVVNISVD